MKAAMKVTAFASTIAAGYKRGFAAIAFAGERPTRTS
jgi:hypothetical protein